jgi:hypothetical protein
MFAAPGTAPGEVIIVSLLSTELPGRFWLVDTKAAILIGPFFGYTGYVCGLRPFVGRPGLECKEPQQNEVHHGQKVK